MEHTSAAPAPNRCWIEDGIIYAEYNKPSDTNDVLELMYDCMGKIRQAHVTVAPIIIIFNAMGSLSGVNLASMSKLINTGLVKYLSSIYVVGAERVGNPTLITVSSRLFLGGRVRVCKELAEAKRLASEKVEAEDRPLLEQ